MYKAVIKLISTLVAVATISGCSLTIKEEVIDPFFYDTARAAAPLFDPICMAGMINGPYMELVQNVIRTESGLTLVFPKAGEFTITQNNVRPIHSEFLMAVDYEIERGYSPLGWIVPYQGKIWVGISHANVIKEDGETLSCDNLLLKEIEL